MNTNTTNTYPDTMQNQLEPRTKHLLSKLYQSESKLVQKRNSLIEHLEEIDNQIEDIVKQRSQLSDDLKKISESGSDGDLEQFEKLLEDVEEKQRWWASKAAEQVLETASQRVSTFADRAADAGKTTWERLRSTFSISKDNWEDVRDAYQKEAQTTVEKIDQQIKVLEGKMGEATEEVKGTIESQKKDLTESRQKVNEQITQLKNATKEAWDDVEKKVENTVDQAKKALKNYTS